MRQQNYKIIQWSDNLVIDNGIIDSDHRYLMKLSNEFIQIEKELKSPGQAHDLINNLHEYAAVHFRREEKLQELIGFPSSATHMQEHRDLESSLGDIKKLLRDPQNCDLAMISAEIAGLLSEWLVVHILEHDIAMRDHAGKIRQASKNMPDIGDITFL